MRYNRKVMINESVVKPVKIQSPEKQASVVPKRNMTQNPALDMDEETLTPIGKKQQLPPERVLALGFLVMILIGTALLSLPIATVTGQRLPLFDALFTAASATCVTGLVAVDTGTTFSAFGQGVLLLLIQVGGLGFMVFATLGLGLLGKKLSLSDRVLIRESMSGSSMSGLMNLTCVYGAIALVIELCGALLLSIRFIPAYGVARGLWYALFHAVSAFCNAGFDLFGHFSSLTGFWNDPLVIFTVSVLIILGSTGFFVIFDVLQNRRSWQAYALHTKVALLASGLLLAAGTLLFALLEWNNPQTLAAEGSSIGTKLMNAFFQSVTMRTAGFNSVDLQSMTSASKLVAVMLMFIGASPASTGGGVKTTTVALVLFSVISVIRGQDEVCVMKRRMSTGLVRRALAVVVISLMVLLGCTVLLCAFEQERVPMIDLLFEMGSGVATVGVSAYGTPNLSMASRALIIPVMYFGRVGPLTLALAIASRQNNAKNRMHYPEDKIMIG